MRRASYRQAVEWIGARISAPPDPAAIGKMELAIFVAFLFDASMERVVADITRIAIREASGAGARD